MCSAIQYIAFYVTPLSSFPLCSAPRRVLPGGLCLLVLLIAGTPAVLPPLLPLNNLIWFPAASRVLATAALAPLLKIGRGRRGEGLFRSFGVPLGFALAPFRLAPTGDLLAGPVLSFGSVGSFLAAPSRLLLVRFGWWFII
jgi:hypothetical protein